MGFQIGDTLIHWSYGVGEIVRIEEKSIRDHPTSCYVFQTSDLTAWVPINELQQTSLRLPTPADEFTRMFDILTSPSEALPEDRVLRKDALLSQMRDGQIASIFRVVRDLTHFQRKTKLNDQERSILERAKRSLLTEWNLSLGVPVNQAQVAMLNLLGE
jgi:RNA polymerase-interacting CarD/CdnL/TRCF family regulator